MLAIRALVHDIFDVRAALKLSLGHRRTRTGKAPGLPDAASDHSIPRRTASSSGSLKRQPSLEHPGEVPTRADVITVETLKEALVRASRERLRLGEALVAMGVPNVGPELVVLLDDLPPGDVLRALAVHLQMDYLSADEMPSVPPSVKELSPKYLRQ